MDMPTFYIPHGAGPCFFMQPHEGFGNMWDDLGHWLRQLSTEITQHPKAILMVSAHWQNEAFEITSAAQPTLFHDYYGFPEYTYRITYPAPGAPLLAAEICQRLQRAGFKASLNSERGLDHGTFIPLKLVYPKADIPVLQLSLQQDLAAAEHYRAGQCLAALREKGVLIIGSGMSFHNMSPQTKDLAARADAFDDWIHQTLMATRSQRALLLSQWVRAPFARFAHPTEEHLIPLMVACGAAGDNTATRLFHQRLAGQVAIAAYRFG